MCGIAAGRITADGLEALEGGEVMNASLAKDGGLEFGDEVVIVVDEREIGQPVPAEDALGTDDQIVAVGPGGGLHEYQPSQAGAGSALAALPVTRCAGALSRQYVKRNRSN